MPSNHSRYDIDGVRFDALTPIEAIGSVAKIASDPTSPCLVVIKPYVEFLDRAVGDPRIASLLNQADLCLADSVAVTWAAHYLYDGPTTIWRWFTCLVRIITKPASLNHPLPGRAAGASFTWLLLEQAAALHLRVYLVGSPLRNTIEQTAAHLRSKLPKLQIVGTMHGTITTSYATSLQHDLLKTQPDIVLFGLGFPRQEQLMMGLRSQLPHGVLIGEGGTFDYQAFGGRMRRAPGWIRQIGLEWAWRLVLEPKRIKRQLAIPRFMWHILTSKNIKHGESDQHKTTSP